MLCRVAILFFLGLSFSSFCWKENPNPTNTVQLELSNIRSADGHIYVFLYTYENQYPYAPFAYFKFEKSDMKDGQMRVVLNNCPTHEKYALTLIDDENANDDLDRFLGIPEEGYGFSNNVKPLFALPEYEELLIENSHEAPLEIKVQYIF